jgi:adenylate kinase
MRVIMLGPPGAGKGTQGERIASRYEVPHISSGELFRDEVARQTETGRRLRAYLEAGDLVPDDLVLSLIMDRVIAAEADGGWVLDGFPRTLPQAQAAAKIASEAEMSVQAVVYLEVPAEALAARLVGRGENRADDTAQVARHRLEVFTEHTRPLLDFYTQRGIIVRIDASPPVDAVSEAIFAALDRIESPTVP